MAHIYMKWSFITNNNNTAPWGTYLTLPATKNPRFPTSIRKKKVFLSCPTKFYPLPVQLFTAFQEFKQELTQCRSSHPRTATKAFKGFSQDPQQAAGYRGPGNLLDHRGFCGVWVIPGLCRGPSDQKWTPYTKYTQNYKTWGWEHVWDVEKQALFCFLCFHVPTAQCALIMLWSHLWIRLDLNLPLKPLSPSWAQWQGNWSWEKGTGRWINSELTLLSQDYLLFIFTLLQSVCSGTLATKGRVALSTSSWIGSSGMDQV